MNRPLRILRERGSAYVVSLLVLIVLTLLGLSLSLISSTEMQVGSNERTIQRVFYGADSGVGIGVARALVAGDHNEMQVTLNRVAYPGEGGGSPFAPPTTPTVPRPRSSISTQVALGPRPPLSQVVCNLSEASCEEYGGDCFVRMLMAITAAGQRVDGNTTLAQSTVSAIMDMQCIERRGNEILTDLTQGAALGDKIKF